MTDGVGAICQALTALGIDHVFGIPGTQTVPLYDGFRRHGLRTVLTSSELAASFMANGYFRATGRVAVLATIPGPGFTFALTGLAEARLDSVALLYLVGKPASTAGHRFPLQAIDQRAIAAPLLKGCFTIVSPDGAARIVRDAYDLATQGEPGPVMVELDLAALAGDVTIDAPRMDAAAEAPDAAHVHELERLFGRAERPLLLLGQGTLDCSARLQALAERLTIPVLTTPSARGAVAEDHELALGYDPLRGETATVNAFLEQADLVLALGCKLGHNGSAGYGLRFAPDRLVHVDAAADVVGASYPALLGVTARIEQVLSVLERRAAVTGWSRTEVSAVRATLREGAPESVEPKIHGDRALTPREFFRWLRELLPRDAIVVTDSGLHQILTRRYLDVLAPRGLIVPSDFQSMGFGLPAAIGASLGAPERVVVALVGDGGFLMSGLELMTARRERAPIVTFVFNDGHLNQIRLQQLADSGHTPAVDLLNPDFHSLADALGIEYLRFGASSAGDIARALRGGTPVLVEVLVGDSLAMRILPRIARAKQAARAILMPRLREWIGRRLRRPSAA